MSDFENIKIHNYTPCDSEGLYDFPKIKPYTKDIDCEKWINFHHMKSYKGDKSNTGINFFIADTGFERVWVYPDRYVQLIKNYKLVLSPDFSLYADFPKSMQIFNKYRNNWLARYWQDNGVTVIPTISWADESSYEWCFDGCPHNSVVAVSNVGNMKNKDNRNAFINGYEEMIKRLNPIEILFFAWKRFDDIPGNIRWIDYEWK